MSDFLQYDFLFYSLILVFFLGIITGILSPIVVAKKYAFIGEGIAHSTLLGIVLSLCIFNSVSSLNLFLITLVFNLIFVTILAYFSFNQKIPSDSMIGIFLSVTLSLAIILHFYFIKQSGDLLNLLFGNILLIEQLDIYLIISLLVLLLLIFLPFFKKWIFYLFDEEGAYLSGINVKFFHYILFYLLTLVIVCAVRFSGSILINTLLLIPGAFSYIFAKNMRAVFYYSLAFSIVTSITGLFLSNVLSTPPSAIIALTQFLVLFLSYLIKKFFFR